MATTPPVSCSRPPPHPALSASAKRWQIWQSQANEGSEPCFGTAFRLVCRDYDCPFRNEYLSLRADWRR